MTEPIEVPTYAALGELIGPASWTRGQARINDISIELTTHESYDPRAPQIGAALLFDLANMRTKKDGLAFAHVYGLLFESKPRPGYNEPFSRWLGYARELRGALTMHAHAYALPRCDAEHKDGISQKLKASITPFRARLGSDGHGFLDQYTLEEQANILVAEVINAHLPQSRVAATALLEQEDEHGHWSIGKGAPPSFLWYPQFDNLVEFAHFMLALSAMSRLPVRACQGCTRVFVPDPPDKLYHSERCADAARQRLRRTRK